MTSSELSADFCADLQALLAMEPSVPPSAVNALAALAARQIQAALGERQARLALPPLACGQRWKSKLSGEVIAITGLAPPESKWFRAAGPPAWLCEVFSSDGCKLQEHWTSKSAIHHSCELLP